VANISLTHKRLLHYNRTGVNECFANTYVCL